MKEQVEDECRYRDYSPQSAQDCASVCAERCQLAVRELTGQQFKILINCAVLPRGSGMHTVSSCYYDAAHDGSTIYRYENQTLCVIVSVYGVKLE